MTTKQNRITIVTHRFGTTRYLGMVPEFATPKSRDLYLYHVDQTDDVPRAAFDDGEWKKAEVYDGDMLWLYTIEQGPIDAVRVVELTPKFPNPAVFPVLPLQTRFYAH